MCYYTLILIVIVIVNKCTLVTINMKDVFGHLLRVHSNYHLRYDRICGAVGSYCIAYACHVDRKSHQLPAVNCSLLHGIRRLELDISGRESKHSKQTTNSPFCDSTVIRGQYGTARSVSSDIWHLIHPGPAVCFVVIPNMGQREVGTMTTNTLTSLSANGSPLPLLNYANYKKNSKLSIFVLILYILC